MRNLASLSVSAFLLFAAAPAAAHEGSPGHEHAPATVAPTQLPGLPAAVEAALPAPTHKVPEVQARNIRKPPPPPSLWSFKFTEGNPVKIALAIVLLGLLLWGWQLEDQGKRKEWRRSRRLAIGLIGVLGVVGWFNFGKFHGGTNFVHVWEHYHYYMGAKYFPELRYTRLYECSAVAEMELRGKDRVLARTMRDLTSTNLIGPTRHIVDNPERCTAHFSEARWAAFKQDTSFFMKRLGSRWHGSQKDHGFNGTPWWTIGGSILSNLIGPASERTMFVMALLDPLLIVLMFAAIWWAFGIEIFAVAATFFAVNYPSRYYWNGGGLLRYDYLAAAVIGICLLRKKRAKLGGALLAVTAAFRIFPVFFSLGPAMQGLWRWYKEKRFPAEARRVLIGALIATAILVPGSLVVARGGFEVYSDFIANTAKHADTPLTNHMGLRTVVSWRPWANAIQLKNESLTDPFQVWKEQRLNHFDQLRWFFVAINLALLWLVWRTSRDEPAWVAATLAGVVMIPAAAELTSYYYAVLIPGAFLMEKRREIGIWMILLALSTHLLTRVVPSYDDKHVWMGFASVIFGFVTLWYLGAPKPAAAGEAETARQPALAKVPRPQI